MADQNKELNDLREQVKELEALREQVKELEALENALAVSDQKATELIARVEELESQLDAIPESAAPNKTTVKIGNKTVTFRFPKFRIGDDTLVASEVSEDKDLVKELYKNHPSLFE